MPPRAAYIHIPFCRRRCGYCNFTVIAGHEHLQRRYLDALERELQGLQPPHQVDTIYVGGGTPTELAGDQLARLCHLIRHAFPTTSSDSEWTVEANPWGLTSATARHLARAGVNRVSLGVQSFQDPKLAALERDHRLQDILTAYGICRDHFASVAVDLMFATPGESLAGWQEDLEQAMNLAPDHISVYGLTYEKGARFWAALRRGTLQELEEGVQAEMYQWAIDQLQDAGWEHYEISNFARPGHRSRHNQVYWLGQEYFGVGAGAAGYVDHRRQTNHRSTFTYIGRVLKGLSPVADCEVLSPEERARERLVFGLRMLDGVDRHQFAQTTGYDVDELVAEPLRSYVELGLLSDSNGRIRLTRHGLLVSDSMWPDFL